MSVAPSRLSQLIKHMRLAECTDSLSHVQTRLEWRPAVNPQRVDCLQCPAISQEGRPPASHGAYGRDAALLRELSCKHGESGSYLAITAHRSAWFLNVCVLSLVTASNLFLSSQELQMGRTYEVISSSAACGGLISTQSLWNFCS